MAIYRDLPAPPEIFAGIHKLPSALWLKTENVKLYGVVDSSMDKQIARDARPAEVGGVFSVEKSPGWVANQ